MEVLSDRIRLDALLKKWGIPDHFDTRGLPFQLVKFRRGEFLVAPFLPMDAFLFLVQGQVHIYSLRDNGGIESVCLAKPGILLGDAEFIQAGPLPFYTEALEDGLCVSLPMEPNRARLETDVRFLHLLLKSLSDKFQLFAVAGHPAQSVEEKLLAFLRILQPDHTLHSMTRSAIQLHCSRSQLQRVVRRLCQSGALIRVGKGTYRLAP